MSDKDRILQVEIFDELGEIVGVRIHVVAIPRLIRASVPASIDGDAPISIRRHKEHLILKGVGGKRPTVIENDRLSGTPIFVIHIHAIFGRDNTHIYLLMNLYRAPM
jgi:hypothetical protein